MTDRAYTLFDTAIGRCAIAWSTRGIAAVQLPEKDEAKTRARLLRRCRDAREAAPPPDVRRAIDAIAALLRGEAVDLGHIALDLGGVPPFNAAVYAVARAIPFGTTLGYGEIAKRLGEPERARDVGQAMGQNPVPLLVPCHRVVAAGGKAGGFSANGGVITKLRLLAIEGAQVEGTLPLFEGAQRGKS